MRAAKAVPSGGADVSHVRDVGPVMREHQRRFGVKFRKCHRAKPRPFRGEAESTDAAEDVEVCVIHAAFAFQSSSQASTSVGLRRISVPSGAHARPL